MGTRRNCIYRALFLVAFDLYRIHSTPSFTKPPVTAPSTLSFPADAHPVSRPLRFSAFSGPDEGLLEGTHLVVDSTITSGDNRISTHSLLDCGATGFAFVHEQFVYQHKLPRYTLRVPRALEVGKQAKTVVFSHVFRNTSMYLLYLKPETGWPRTALDCRVIEQRAFGGV